MYESLLDTDPVKLYIKNNCGHVLYLPDTTNILVTNKIVTNYEDYYVKSPERNNHPSKYTSKAGLYLFTCVDTGLQYVGSAICLNTSVRSNFTRSYSSSNKLTADSNNLNPYYVTGFCDGESSFIIDVS